VTSRRLQAAALAVVITALTVFALAGHSRLSGPVLWGFGDTTHGIHRDDLVVAAIWLVGMVICALVARRPNGGRGADGASREE